MQVASSAVNDAHAELVPDESGPEANNLKPVTVAEATKDSLSKRKAGRPLGSGWALGEVRRKEILANAKTGMAIDKAIVAAGISAKHLDKFRAAYPDFLHEVEIARAQREAELLKAVAESKMSVASSGAAWILARGFGWTETQKQEITGKDGGPLQQLTILATLVKGVGAQEDK